MDVELTKKKREIINKMEDLEADIKKLEGDILSANKGETCGYCDEHEGRYEINKLVTVSDRKETSCPRMKVHVTYSVLICEACYSRSKYKIE